MLLSKRERGQGLVEYALILVLVAVVVIAVLMILGPIIGYVFSRLNSYLQGKYTQSNERNFPPQGGKFR
jgi:pilus assembly protein Flp/PilA